MSNWQRKFVNFALFQMLWLACILGAARGLLWPGILVFTGMCVWQFLPMNRVKGDLKLLAVCGLVGILLDSLWINLGLIRYQTAIPFDNVAPLWIILLWLGLALTLNHSLSWLKPRPWLAGLFSAFASPLSYLAGSRLGAAELMPDLITPILAFGLSWALLMPVLVWLAAHWFTGNSVFSPLAVLQKS